MARPRSYDPEEVLDRSVKVFWERGYHDTSIQDLVEATGTQRYGLYESFGDKHGLFIAALRRYEEVWIGTVLCGLEVQDASLPEILEVFEKLRTPTPAAPAGCLMCNTAAEMGGGDPVADAMIGRYVQRMHTGFEVALKRARERGEISATIDPPSHARFLAGSVVGIAIHKKTSAGQEALDAFVSGVVATLEVK